MKTSSRCQPSRYQTTALFHIIQCFAKSSNAAPSAQLGRYPQGINPSRLSSCVIRLNSALIYRTFATWTRDRRPCFVCAAAARALPSAVRGPVDFPPCNLHRLRSLMAGFWQGVPLRVFARHLWPGQSGPKRVAWPASASRILHSPASCRSAIVSSGTRRNCSHSAARFFNVGTMARAAASSSSRVLSFDGAIETNRKGMTLIVTTPVINLRSGFPNLHHNPKTEAIRMS
jgi:hypothetical protein